MTHSYSNEANYGMASKLYIIEDEVKNVWIYTYTPPTDGVVLT
jgi:hypothetical protein